MKKRSINFGFLILGLLAFAFLQSCYYDNEEDLYPSPPACDTTNITYSATVWPIISESCTSCHSGSGAGGGVLLTNHAEVADACNNGRLLGAIRHESGYSPMPKAQAKMSDCDIKKIELWVANGTPDN